MHCDAGIAEGGWRPVIRPVIRQGLVAGLVSGHILAGGQAVAQIWPDAPLQGQTLQGMPRRAGLAPTHDIHGGTGLIEMPSARMQPDGELSMTMAGFGPRRAVALTFQITPWLQGTFRYAGIRGLPLGGYGTSETYYDRSFDLRLRLLAEGGWWPAVTLGVRDFIGTGHGAGEYIALSRGLGSGLTLTGGLGWGRLGSRGQVFSTGRRPPVDLGWGTMMGGMPKSSHWFRGPVAPFAGVEWQLTDSLGLKAEFSSDNHDIEARMFRLFDRRTSVNLGLEYRLNERVHLGAYHLYGSEVGFRATLLLDPSRRPLAVRGPAPLPVRPRPERISIDDDWPVEWAASGGTWPALAQRDALRERLHTEGITLEWLGLDAHHAEVRVRAGRHEAAAQAFGRTARVMAHVLPPSVEIFDIVLLEQGLPVVGLRLRRTDLEELEFAPDNVARLRDRVQFIDPVDGRDDLVPGEGTTSRFFWGMAPFMRYELFDPESPFRMQMGLRLAGGVRLAPGLSLSGALTTPLAGRLDKVDRGTNSTLPPVRTLDYLRNARDLELERLQLDWYARPMRDVYSRLSAGYLERGFGGVSAELLWKPLHNRLGLGIEINRLRMRSLRSRTGFEPYEVTSGHLSAYWTMEQGYGLQLDVGRYLAGDLGATLSLERVFRNGWRVGVFATRTNVSAADFGEGSFDKGIRLSIPIGWSTGTPQRGSMSTQIRPIQRDGGARLDVGGRLYGLVQDRHVQGVDAQWGRVWQ